MSTRRVIRDPSALLVSAIPVVPRALRPMTPLADGRWAKSDLNDLYLRLMAVIRTSGR